MNVEWRGGSDMTLHRLTREDLLGQFLWIVKHIGKYSKSQVVVINRHGRKSRIVKVKEDVNGVFLYPVDEDFGQLVHLAPYMGSDMRIMDFDGLREELKKGVSNDVWLQFPDGDPKTVVGKVLAVKAGDELIVSLTPVTKDIEEVNREVHRRVSETCRLAADGMECGACLLAGECEDLKRVDKEMTDEKEGKQEG